MQWVAAPLVARNPATSGQLMVSSSANISFLSQDAASCEEIEIKNRSAEQTRCRITDLAEEREGVNIGILLLWQQSGKSIGGLMNVVGREIENYSQKS